MEFLQRFNSHLLPLESSLRKENLKEEYPNIFVIGLPRSGTTLATQIIFNGFEIACTNNLVAKFWSAPLVGFYLSKILLGQKKDQVFNSEYGKNDILTSPHEFSYFWHQLIKMNSNEVSTYRPDEHKAKVDWKFAKDTFLNINSVVQSPVVYKPLELAGFYLEEFDKILDKMLFVYIERNPGDIAMSLAKGRLDYHGDVNSWFSTYPLNYYELKDKTYWMQIAGQVRSLVDMYDDGLKNISSKKVLRLGYHEMCAAPGKFLEKIAKKVKDNCGFTMKPFDVPANFLATSPKLENEEIRTKILEGLRHYNLI